MTCVWLHSDENPKDSIQEDDSSPPKMRPCQISVSFYFPAIGIAFVHHVSAFRASMKAFAVLDNDQRESPRNSVMYVLENATLTTDMPSLFRTYNTEFLFRRHSQVTTMQWLGRQIHSWHGLHHHPHSSKAKYPHTRLPIFHISK